MARKSGAERRKELIEAALRLVARKGSDRLTAEQLAREVGISQPGVFRHFSSMDRLFESIGEHVLALAEATWRGADDRQCRLERLRSLVIGQLRLISETPALPALLFSRASTGRGVPMLAAVMKGFTDRLEAAAAAAQTDGILRRDVAASDAALLMLGLIQALVLRWTLAGRSFDLVEEGRRLLDVQLRCLEPEKT
jgi:AcrR family transcriptional regulator